MSFLNRCDLRTRWQNFTKRFRRIYYSTAVSGVPILTPTRGGIGFTMSPKVFLSHIATWWNKQPSPYDADTSRVEHPLGCKCSSCVIRSIPGVTVLSERGDAVEIEVAKPHLYTDAEAAAIVNAQLGSTIPTSTADIEMRLRAIPWG